MARTLVVWCPDWPLTAAGIPPQHPAVVLRSDRVEACSSGARALGIRIGLRRREAQARCPQLTVLDADPGRESRMFDPAVAAAVDLVPAIEVVRPGLLALGVGGPARVFGGEAALAARLRAAVNQAIGETVDVHPSSPPGPPSDGQPRDGRPSDGPPSDGPPDTASVAPAGCRIGIADGLFAAMLAARHTAPDTTAVYAVAAGDDRAFLAPQPLGALSVGLLLMGDGGRRPRGIDPAALTELITLGHQLGLRTLGDFAALPRTAVGDRFGTTGVQAHQLARGDDDRPVVARGDQEAHTVEVELDPPAVQIETAAFATRGPAEVCITALSRAGQTCTLVSIEVETEHGELLVRRWRTNDGFTAELLVDRLRWQLDGWLSGSAGQPQPTSGIARVRIIPEEVVAGAEQGSLLDASAAVTPKVTRALTRVQGMLGPDAVVSGSLADGRDPATWATTTLWGQQPPASPSRPWPGRLPPPAPATVLATPWAAEVVDGQGATVGVSGRGMVTGVPARIRAKGRSWRAVTGWAGPWPADERWWDVAGRRRARFQLVDEDGLTCLLAVEDGRWQIEAIYD